MTSLEHARAFMGDSLGFHIIFALFGVGLPVATFLLEWWAVRTKNGVLLQYAHILARVMVFLVIVGVASGTLIAIQMSVFWSGLVEFGAPIIGVPFTLEGYAFLFEVIFLALHASTWKRITGIKHALLLLPVALGAFLSAVCITLANAWMNDPHGFTVVNGLLTDIDLRNALFTKTAFFEIAHSITAYYLATFLSVAAVCTWVLWRHRPKEREKQNTLQYIITRFVLLAIVCEVVLAGVGDASLRYLSQSEPRKFAAIEAVTKTTAYAPYRIGAHVNTETMEAEGGVALENVLSIMTGFSADTTITGLQAFPQDTWPMLIVHELFEIKMLFVGFLFLVPCIYLACERRLRRFRDSKLLRMALIACAPVSILLVELGWMITELGRQPYAVTGYLTTAEAFSKNPTVGQWGLLFPTTFVVLLVVSWIGVRKIIRSPQK